MLLLQVLAALLLCAARNQAEVRNVELVRVHNVTLAEYEELLRLSQGGNEISEARLISGLQSLANSLRNGLAASFVPTFFNYFASERDTSKTHSKQSYPLCVLPPAEQTPGYDTKQLLQRRTINWQLEDYVDEPQYDYVDNLESEDQLSGYRDEQSNDYNANEDTPAVSCILVVKDTTTDSRPTHKPRRQDNQQHIADPYYSHNAAHYHNAGYYYPPPPPPPPPLPYYIPRYYAAYANPAVYRATAPMARAASTPKRHKPHRRRSKKNQSRNGRKQAKTVYQPASYPQIEYTSNYPKVNRNYAQIYTAPVYIRQAMPAGNESYAVGAVK